MRDYPECIISLNDSQILRFIDEFNNALDSDDKAKEIKRKMKQVKKRKRSPETKALIRNLYQTLYDIQYQKDYLCVVMDSNKDYDLLNSKGFTVNGVITKDFLEQTGALKIQLSFM